MIKYSWLSLSVTKFSIRLSFVTLKALRCSFLITLNSLFGQFTDDRFSSAEKHMHTLHCKKGLFAFVCIIENRILIHGSDSPLVTTAVPHKVKNVAKISQNLIL